MAARLKNLIPGQYQFSDLVVGKGTNVRLVQPEIEPHQVTANDIQSTFADEKRPGRDQLVPGTLTFTFEVLKTFIRPNAFNPNGLTDDIFKEHITVEQLEKIWRFDEGRKYPGEHMPIYICDNDGNTRVVYGRPASGLAYQTVPPNFAGWIECVGQFRRTDTLSYRALEDFIELDMGVNPAYLTRLEGNAPCWFRILLQGPMTNPVITVGEYEIALNYSIDADEIVEISSYPWQRRVVNDERVNLTTKMIGRAQYLDRLMLAPNTPIPVRWTSDEQHTFVPALGNQSWAEDIRDANNFKLPSEFRRVAGKPVVRLDLFNPKGPRKFLGSGMIGGTSAVIYDDKQYNTSNQYLKAKIVEPFGGRSGLVLMSDANMTNYLVLEVMTYFGDHKLRLRTGTSPTAYSSIRAEYDLPGVLDESDDVGVGYDPATNKFDMYINDVIVGPGWTDTGNVVNKANRHSGMIFDMDGTLLTIGTGFVDIVGYDRAVSPVPTGRAFLFWQDAWTTIK